ncbi:MAG: 50S ribosomal protein L23 [Candidatus Gracilibacteria bacterium]|nr:50S ribosomal protein L23 [Candidatus Gracilibacteria bacterium]
MKTIIKKALVTEKSHKGQDIGTYTFLVGTDANKIEIAKEIETLYGVQVANVNIIRIRPKVRKLKGSRIHTKRSMGKKALVTLQKRAQLDLTKLVK